MDIGSQQRVIIVELDKKETPDLEPTKPEPDFVEAGMVGDWPLPLDINVEPVS